MRKPFLLFLFTLLFSHLLFSQQSVQINAAISGEMSGLNDLYLHLHQNPELSMQEKNTSAKMAEVLKNAGFSVTEDFGIHGVVGIMKNGDGPVIMVRTDMDALPVTEETGLPYASVVKSISEDGNEVGVMHACGHDIHMSVWAGTARVLSKIKKDWNGTVIFVAQSAEENGQGAKAIIEAGLFEKFPRPDYNLAIHDDPSLAAGTVGICPEFAMANVDMIDIHVYGVGGHGALPQNTIDPVVISAKIILDLQTIVSRELSPLDPAVITVGKIEGGTVGNVIPEKVDLQLTVRSFSDEVRTSIIEKIKRTCKGVALAAGVPDDKLPEVMVKDQFTPSLYNEPELSKRMFSVFESCIGKENVFEIEPRMVGEDFSRYGRQEPPIPSLMYRLGTTDPELYQRAQIGNAEISGLHSSKFAPDYELTIRTGVLTMTHAVLDLMNNPEK